ncbi:MAG: twitch domain-containing radical SAM protein [Bdellovibrionales bacterium]
MSSDGRRGGPDQNRFCWAPWGSLALHPNGEWRVCAVSTKGLRGFDPASSDYVLDQDLNDLREKFLTGEKDASCRSCWSKQALGGPSHRDFINKRLAGASLEDRRLEIRRLDLALGSICNLRCVMCRPQYSTRWAQDAKSLLEKDPQFWAPLFGSDLKQSSSSADVDQIIEMIATLPSLEHLELKGGECLLHPRIEDVLTAIRQKSSEKKLSFQLISNGTVIKDPLLKLIDDIDRSSFFVSVDGTGDVFRYIRSYSPEFSHFEAGLKKIERALVRSELYMHFTISALNVHHIPEFVSWFDSFNEAGRWTRSWGLVAYPLELSLQSLSSDFLKVCLNRCEHIPDPRIRSLIASVQSAEPQGKTFHPRLKKYLQDLDEIRSTNFRKCFPELAASIDREKP